MTRILLVVVDGESESETFAFEFGDFAWRDGEADGEMTSNVWL